MGFHVDMPRFHALLTTLALNVASVVAQDRASLRREVAVGSSGSIRSEPYRHASLSLDDAEDEVDSQVERLFRGGRSTEHPSMLEAGTTASAGSALSTTLGRRTPPEIITEAETFDRMTYASPHIPAAPLEVSERYLLFDIDEGGLNNIRIGWEMAGIVAQHTGRTLVLPPSQGFYLIPDQGDSKAEDYVDLRRLQSNLPTLTFKAFCNREMTQLKLPGFVNDSGPSVSGKWKDWARAEFHTVSGTDHCDLRRYESTERVVYAATTGEDDRMFGCGDWAAIGQPVFTQDQQSWTLPVDGWSLLRNGFVWHPDAYRFASRAVHSLGLFEYVALHARYNDFQFKDKRQPSSMIIENLGVPLPPGEAGNSIIEIAAASSTASSIAATALASKRGASAVSLLAPLLTNGTTLYVSTDETDPSYFKPFHDHGIRTLHWPDVASKLEDFGTPERLAQLKGVVEQIICAYSRVFVGTELSTFSAYAQRMRIYADAPVKERLYHTVPRTAVQGQRVEDEMQAWDKRGGFRSFKADDASLVSLAFIPHS